MGEAAVQYIVKYMYNTYIVHYSSGYIALEMVLQLLSGGPPPPGHLGAVPQRRERVEGGAHIEVDRHRVVWLRVAAVVVDDVANSASTAIHHPVVTIKGKFVAEGGRDGRRDGRGGMEEERIGRREGRGGRDKI